ncbi:MAG: methyl-accepting chemotaxis protein [Betaproteobacteria bacterium]|nr:methyl-accepting chemotaxis protein [Betaproteobacteria bacterium]
MRALGDMNNGLARLIGEVRHASNAITLGTSQIDTANAKLAERFSDQASGLDHTASTMEHLTATVGRNAEHARRAAERAGNASAIADKGGVEVRRAVDTMSAVDAGARRITDIVGVIDSIAFQTNILALNAAVEAARAGTQGRGFAVVASEVRSLAQKSAAAAREIKTLIADAIARVEEGGRVVQAAGDTIAQTVAAVQEVTGIVGEIAALSNEQASRLQEINHEVAELVQKTRGNTVLVNHAADAARANSEQAAALQDAISVFQLSEGAAGDAGGALEAPERLALASRA